MTQSAARDILALDPGEPALEARVSALLAGDPEFGQRLIATVGLPGLGRRSGIEADDLLSLFGLRLLQQVSAGLLLEDAGADATGVGILAAVAAHGVAGRIGLVRGEEAFLAAWLNVTPAWRQAPPSWGPGADLLAALDRHANLGTEAPISGARADLVAQTVRLGELLASLASPYSEASVMEAVQRAARLGLAPGELAAACIDITRNAAEWGRHFGRTIAGDIKLGIEAPDASPAMRFAAELAVVYRYLLQNAAIDAVTGLPNARYFRTRLESEWAAARRRGGALSIIAIDHVGDSGPIARALREAARMQDVVCRTAETQFMLICIDTHAEYAEKAAARLSKSVAQDGARVSLGVATLDSMISSVDDLIERAQSASRQALVAGEGVRVWAGP
ncbi:MAG: GGDEF domain-containing protein [Burkholderiales bacterium]|nr:GGDEF domain-containing protein [Burkholderiales bacterium]